MKTQSTKHLCCSVCVVSAFLRWKLKLAFIFCWCHNRCILDIENILKIMYAYSTCHTTVCTSTMAQHQQVNEEMIKQTKSQYCRTPLYELKKSVFFRVAYEYSQNWVLLLDCMAYAHLCCHILSRSHTWKNPLQTIEYSYKCRISSWARVPLALSPSMSLSLCVWESECMVRESERYVNIAYFQYK